MVVESWRTYPGLPQLEALRRWIRSLREEECLTPRQALALDWVVECLERSYACGTKLEDRIAEGMCNLHHSFPDRELSRLIADLG